MKNIFFFFCISRFAFIDKEFKLFLLKFMPTPFLAILYYLEFLYFQKAKQKKRILTKKSMAFIISFYLYLKEKVCKQSL